MKKKQQLEHLYKLYLKNKCNSKELETFFELLNDNSNDHEIKALISSTWENTYAIPDINLIPDFIPFEAKQLKLNANHKTTRALRRFITVAAAILLIIGGLYFLKSDIQGIINPVHQQQVSSSTDERKQLLLADGTKVWLSPNSKFNYPDKFKGDQRLVSLDGEAFFEVAHDSKHPFIIKTGRVSTTVLGTSFNISAFPKHNTINVTLVTGKVAVAFEAKNNSQSEIMLPNQQIIVDKTNEKLTKVNFPGAASFLNKRLGLFEYKGAALQEVINDIELQYNVQIKLDTDLANKTFYGNLNMNDNADQTLNKLCLVMETTWKRNGGQYVILK